jgi:hypothetical protein
MPVRSTLYSLERNKMDVKTYDHDTNSVAVMHKPEFYTSIADWKPVTTEQFVKLLHGYDLLPQNSDEHGHSLMSRTVARIGYKRDGKYIVIHYSRKSVDNPVSSPVLMTMHDDGRSQPLCFASTKYGQLVDQYQVTQK